MPQHHHRDIVFAQGESIPLLPPDDESIDMATENNAEGRADTNEETKTPIEGESGYTDEESNTAGSPQNTVVAEEGRVGEDAIVYRVYKIRWFGLVQLVLLNIIVSWDWLSFSPVADTAATFFSTDTGVINWLSTAFLFSFAVAAPATIYTLYWGGPRLAFMTASVLILLGNWIRYGGTRSSPPRFGVVMFGQILTGLAQPFVLSAPTRYSDLWFTPQGRVSATAVASLANPFGGALGQLINPLLCTKPSDIPNMTLYVAIISSVATIPTLFLPEKPKTPVAPSSVAPRPSLPDTLRLLSRNANFWLLLTVFSLNVGLFNCISSILEQVLKPYGFSESQAGIAGALLILVGLVAAAVTSPLVDRTKRYLFLIKTFVPIIAVCDLVFIWAPGSRSEVAPYFILSVLGAASFSLLPIALEWLVEVTYPATPEASSTILWTAGQVLGGLFIIISNALKASAESSPPHHMGRALIFQAVVAIASVVPTLLLGVIGKAYRGRAEVDAQAGSTVTSPTTG